MEKQEIEIIETGDGSHSLIVPGMDETYHSRHGAITESRYVFLKMGIAPLTHLSNIHILEIGFGTGLNALLTSLFTSENLLKVEYTALEAFPVPESIYQKLNYGTLTEAEPLFQELHDAPWNEPVQITDRFTLTKQKVTLEEASIPSRHFSLIYFDAFAPSRQAEIWSLENLQKMYDCLASGGILVTYCAQGAFKRNLKALGFDVEELPGPPGKKEMVRAQKPHE